MLLRLAAVLLVLTVAAPGPASAEDVRPVPDANPLSSSGPRLRAPDLLGGLRCTGDVAGAALTPVLLLHGTGSTPEETWGPVHLPQLAAQGRPACTVPLPDRATGDQQVSVEVVVAAVREVARRRGGRIAVVGHSQGATLAVTALKYWPDLPGLVEDYVGLAPTLQPGVTGDVMCVRPCSAPFQQRRSGSVFFASTSAHPLPAGPSYTTIATRYDEIAAPAPEASRLDGATNVVLQDPCPAKVVEHFGLVVDGTTYALVQDALAHPGPTAVARLPVDGCLQALPPGSDPLVVAPLVAEAVANDLVANGASEKLEQEPEVRCWVLATCADVDDRGRLLTAAVRVAGGVRVTAQAPGTLRAVSGGRTVTAALRVGTQDVAVPGSDRLRLETSTSWYRVAAPERELAAVPPTTRPAPAAAAPAGRVLPATGGSVTSGGAALVALVLLLVPVGRRARS